MPLKLFTAFAAVAVAPRLQVPPVVAAAADDIALEPAPIDPSWIVSGTPVARCGLHSPAADGTASTLVWDCTAGVFDWTFHVEETVMILEGSVRVTAEDGSVRRLAVGDVAYFAQGTRARWEIDDYVRKLAFCRRDLPQPAVALAIILSKMRTALRRIGRR